MAGPNPVRPRAGILDDIEDWMARRRAEIGRLGAEADSAGRQLWDRATQTGENLIATRPSDVLALGAQFLDQRKREAAGPVHRNGPVPGPTSSSRPPPNPASGVPNGAGSGSWLDRSSTAKAMADSVARDVGVGIGLARGAGNTVKGVGESAAFLGRLLNPVDSVSSPRGDAAWDQLFAAGSRALDYAKNGISSPGNVVDDIKNAGHEFSVRTDPNATPMASTFPAEWSRNLEIGKNRGEFAFDVGSTLFGGTVLKELSGLGNLSKEALVTKYLGQGFSPTQADYLAQPYIGAGHHFWPQGGIPKTVLGVPMPKGVAGQRLPSVVGDSMFNVLSPRGISRGEMYARHYQVDPQFYGAKLPARVGGGSWSGKALGLQTSGPLGRVWYGSPAPLKAAVGAGSTGATGLAYNYLDGDSQ